MNYDNICFLFHAFDHFFLIYVNVKNPMLSRQILEMQGRFVHRYNDSVCTNYICYQKDSFHLIQFISILHRIKNLLEQ